MSEPFYGNLYSRYSLINAKKLNAKNFFEPYAEPEISFRIKEDIDISKAPYTIAVSYTHLTLPTNREV